MKFFFWKVLVKLFLYIGRYEYFYPEKSLMTTTTHHFGYFVSWRKTLSYIFSKIWELMRIHPDGFLDYKNTHNKVFWLKIFPKLRLLIFFIFEWKFEKHENTKFTLMAIFSHISENKAKVRLCFGVEISMPRQTKISSSKTFINFFG